MQGILRGMEHHVYFWLKNEAQTADKRSQFEAGMNALLKAPQIARGVWGVPAATPERPVTDSSWDYALALTFETIEDHDGYQVDPIHDVFIDDFKALWERIEVRDLG